jgi:hypothetical protein
MSDLLKNKISNYEVSPPAEVWNNIASELNENKAFFPLAEKMYNYEVQPPGDSWSNISLALNTVEQPPVRRINSMFVKLAAAAVLLGVILLTSLYFMHEETAVQKVAGTRHQLPEPKPKTNLPQTAEEPEPRPDITTSLPTISFSNPHKIRTNIREHFQRKRRVLTASTVKPDYYDLNQAMNDIAVHANLIRNESGDVIQAPHLMTSGLDGEYITVTGPNGQQTRISVKFADVLPYLNSKNMQDEEWQRKFEDWRKKIMKTSFIPSSNNFLDILELKDFILKDNQQ